MENMLMKNFENKDFGQIRMINVNGKPYAVGSDIAKCLGYKRPSEAISTHCKGAIKYMIPTNGGNQKVNLIDEENILNVLIKCKTKSQEFKEEFLEWLKEENIIMNNKIILASRKEIEFLDMLEKVLEPFDYECIKQYKVLTYRIDLYIPELNIAIEYDENDHKNYTYDAQEKRQKEIEKELNCRFIRVSDKDSDLWNCGYIMKMIYELLQNKGVKIK